MSAPLTDTRPMADDLIGALSRMTGSDHDMAIVSTFCAIALRIIAKTHPMKVREIARLVEIQSHIQPGVTKQ